MLACEVGIQSTLQKLMFLHNYLHLITQTSLNQNNLKQVTFVPWKQTE